MYRWLLAFGLFICICVLLAEIVRPDKSIGSIVIGTISVFGIAIFLKLIEKSIPKDE